MMILKKSTKMRKKSKKKIKRKLKKSKKPNGIGKLSMIIKPSGCVTKKN